MRFARALMTASLVGALALAGCGDDNGDGDNTGDSGNSNTNMNTNDNGNANGNDNETPAACGEGEALDSSFTTATATATCLAFGAITVPLDVTLAAAPVGAVNAGAPTDVEVQVELTLPEDVIANLGSLVDTSVISEASADVDSGESTTSVNVPATVPCSVDFSQDPDGNGAVGPVVVPTPKVTQAWTESGGSLVVQLTDVTFNIASPVPLALSTKGSMPACTWDDAIPSVSFDVP